MTWNEGCVGLPENFTDMRVTQKASINFDLVEKLAQL